MLSETQTSLWWAISEELGYWSRGRSAVNIFNQAYLWVSNLQNWSKGPERMDGEYIKHTNHLYPSVLRNRVRNPFRVYRHLMGMCQTNGGKHIIRYGNWRKHVKVRVTKHGNGTHDTMFAQTVIKVEKKVGKLHDWQWEEVEA